MVVGPGLVGSLPGCWPRSSCSSSGMPIATPPTGDNLVVSPADARIMVAGERSLARCAPPGEWQTQSACFSRRWTSTSTGFAG